MIKHTKVTGEIQPNNCIVRRRLFPANITMLTVVVIILIIYSDIHVYRGTVFRKQGRNRFLISFLVYSGALVETTPIHYMYIQIKAMYILVTFNVFNNFMSPARGLPPSHPVAF